MSTEKFSSRSENILPREDELGDHFRRLPSAPFEKNLPEVANDYWKSATFVIGAYRSSLEHRIMFYDSWRQGRFLVASVCSRALVELWGAIEYVMELHEKRISTGEHSAFSNKLKRLTFGANTPIPLPFGGVTDDKPIHVMDFVRAADKAHPGTLQDYEWLCNATHPSFFQHLYLAMAGPSMDNWSNSRFARHADELLERILTITETSIARLLATAMNYDDIATENVLTAFD